MRKRGEDDVRDYIYEQDLYEDVFYAGGKLYENTEHVEYEDLDFHEFSGNEVVGYTYFTSFYNRGTCLSEILEEELESVREKINNTTVK